MEKENSKKTCFVVSPIGGEGTGIRKRADQLYTHIIRPACYECGFKTVRIDEVNLPGSITQEIIDHLLNDELVIADLTGDNPNVFFEIGYRTSTSKPIIHLKQKGGKIPFDIANIRVFDYDLNDLDLAADAKEKLKKVIKSLDYLPQSNQKNAEVVAMHNQDVQLLYSILYSIDDVKRVISDHDDNMNIKTGELLDSLPEKYDPYRV